ncbi:Mu-like prophage major head subunit gpT family protein [Thermus hydrothermalis]|uniref:Mu-like prophage major head subunit gpT family protein n=1 Tax=Thermus hydrothermalis TaxID=2908148 RepID=UPI001FAA11E4|nr:Mu-like prophage major head subunit gpT family protein [Thermus hydrothermalis]
MLLNRENLQSLSRTLRALVFQTRDSYTPFWPRIALEARTEGRVGVYSWIEDFPVMRPWEGERQVQNLSLRTVELVNGDWELTFAVNRNDVEDDLLDQISANAREYAFRWAQHDDYLITTLLVEGFQRKGPDGANFFGTHRVGKGQFSNAGTAPLSRESFRAALTQMRSLTDSRGYPLGFFYGKPILMVGPSLEYAAKEIVELPTLPQGGANPDYGAAEILVNPWLAGPYANYWFLVDGTRPIRPLVLQRRRDPEWVAKVDPEDENVFKHNQFVFGVSERKAAGYLYWQLAYGSTGAGS